MEKSIKMAKDFLSKALLDMLDLGKGSGPMNHAFDIKDKYKKLGDWNDICNNNSKSRNM